jgi:hypothetical protein
MLPLMRKRLTLSEFLASVDQLERDFDQSTQTIERCIQILATIEERVRQDQHARSQPDWPALKSGSNSQTG